jgi:exodeoxyribonuclease V beta subunit
MKPFNVLDRHLAIRQHYLLEASAGTGKTFSIQNLVCRLLIEPRDLDDTLITEILVVTFTRASTRDLKKRVHQNLAQALLLLTKWLRDGSIDSAMPDFLSACIEEGEQAVKKACKRLKQALFTFDQAQIFTIHGFCRRMLLQYALESDLGLNAWSIENPLPSSDIQEVIKNFFRTEVNHDNYTAGQLQVLLKNDPDHRILANLINSPVDLDPQPSLRELFHSFQTSLLKIKHQYSLNSADMISDFSAQQKHYKKQKSQRTVAQIFEAATRFSKLFDKDNWTDADLDLLIHDELVWVKAFDQSLLNAKKTLPPLHYPDLTQTLADELLPIIERAGDFPHLIARMAADCRKLYRRHLDEEETLGPDEILRKMKEALRNDDFVNKVRETFSAAIIDEFQDTDPLQWEIFHTLFLSSEWKGSLYLVGDPKQSIYSFRQADIYTYLDARMKIGEDNRFSLAVNYRSGPRLVEALNFLFSQDSSPNLFPLPQVNETIPYQPVQAALDQKELPENRGAVHFIVADAGSMEKGSPSLSDLESTIYFPFIAQEIIQLKAAAGYSDKEFAILVKDHYQAKRIAQFLSDHRIPVRLQKGKTLAESPMLAATVALLQAVIKPSNRGLVRMALSTPLLRWTEEDLHQLPTMEFPIVLMRKWKNILYSDGFLPFIEEMLDSVAHPRGASVRENLLSSDEGTELYRDLLQIAHLVADHYLDEWHFPEEIIPFLDKFQEWKKNEDPRVKQISDPDANGVEIMTLHYSKGLEFNVVFALGLINPSEIKEELIPSKSNGQVSLKVIPETSQKYLDYCEERDGEKIRQLYVAMTRAKDLLYVPAVIRQKKTTLKWGAASPIDLYLAKLCQPPADYATLYDRMREGVGDGFIQFLDVHASSSHITYSLYSQAIIEPVDHILAKRENPPLEPPPTVAISYQPLFLSSFSSLHHQQKSRSDSDDAGMAPRDYLLKEKTIHTLPANQQTGLLVHLILEKVNYSHFHLLETPEEASDLVIPFLIGTSLEEWKAPMTEVIHQALKTPLYPIDPPFCIADIDEHSLYREIDFIYSIEPESLGKNIPMQEGFLKGVIDLVFSYQGIYYIADWKTNWLGPDCSHYHLPSLQTAMTENQYDLQAAIYVEALKRYLKLIDDRPFDTCFGGVFYLFVRGMQKGRQTGIYHFFPETFW